MSVTFRHHLFFLCGAFAIAACATSGTPGDEGTGTVGGGGHIDGGDGANPYGTTDEGGTADSGTTMGDSAIVLTDSGSETGTTADTGTDSGPTGHIECPTTLYYANEYINAPSTATVCTMGGPECLANVECCYIDACVQYP